MDNSKNQGYGGYDKDELHNDSLNLYRQGIACFKGNAPCYHLELRDTTRMVWDFHSLMLAIKFLFSLSLSNGTIPCAFAASAAEPLSPGDLTCSSAPMSAVESIRRRKNGMENGSLEVAPNPHFQAMFAF